LLKAVALGRQVRVRKRQRPTRRGILNAFLTPGLVAERRTTCVARFA
jgi:hypothetical protein